MSNPSKEFELPPSALLSADTPTEEKIKELDKVEKGVAATLGKYTTSTKEDDDNEVSRSLTPTDLARKTNSIKDTGLDQVGSEHIFREVDTFRPVDVYSELISPGRSLIGLEDDDKLLWDYVIVFDVPDEDEDHPDILPYVNSKWKHPAHGLDHKLSKKKKKKNNKIEIKAAEKQFNSEVHRRSSIQIFKDKISKLAEGDDKHKYSLRDLVKVFYDISSHNGPGEEDDEESGLNSSSRSPPESPLESPLESPHGSPNGSPHGIERQSTLQRLSTEDREWLEQREHLNEIQKIKLAPAIKHFPGNKFFARIYNEVAEGRNYLDRRRFAIAKAFVVIGLIAEQCGLNTYAYWSSTGDQILCKIRADPPELKVMADKQDYSLSMAPHFDHRCPIPAHLEYDQDSKLDWVWKRHGVKLANGEYAWSRFRRVDRLKLIDAHIDDFIVLRRLVKLELCSGYFPIDDFQEKQMRELDWEKPLNVMHIREYYGESVALYFAFLDHYKGSLFFISVVGMLVQFWQVAERYIPGLTAAETGFPEDVGSLIFSAVIAVWGTLFLEFWKRKEATLTTNWGMTDFESREEPRPEFIGEMRESVTIGTLARRRADETGEELEAKAWADAWRKARGYNTQKVDHELVVDWYGKPKMWASSGTRRRRLFITLSFTGGFLLVTIASTISIFIMRAALRYSSGGVVLSGIVGGGTNAILIMSLQSVYDRLTIYMTDWENWETETEWGDSRAVKTFVFNFVNSFASFFYIAFYRKENDGGCIGACEHTTFGSDFDRNRCPKTVEILSNYSIDGIMWPSNITFTDEYREYKGDCVMEMWIQLSLIFMSRLVIGNLLEIGYPVIRAHFQNAKNAKQREENLEIIQNETKDKNQDKDEDEDKNQNVTSTTSTSSPKSLQQDETLLTEINAAKGDYDTFGDYAELVTQIGFLSLFVVCFPIAPMIAMMSNEAEVKIDLYKLMEMCKHPVPNGAQDIGKWQQFMEMTLYMAAMTNAGMFAFTTDVMASQTFNLKMVAFVAFVIFVQSIKGVCAFLIPDIPEEILQIQKRHKSLNETLIKRAILWDDDQDEQIDGEKFQVKVHWVHKKTQALHI